MRFSLAKTAFGRFFSPKTIQSKQICQISFVLAVLSLGVIQGLALAFPFGGAWLNSHGVFALDAVYTGFFVVAFISLQALILFGFPLYYAQDQRSHMTGFRILLCTLAWMAFLVAFLGAILYKISGFDLDAQTFGDFDDQANVHAMEDAQMMQDGEMMPAQGEDAVTELK